MISPIEIGMQAYQNPAYRLSAATIGLSKRLARGNQLDNAVEVAFSQKGLTASYYNDPADCPSVINQKGGAHITHPSIVGSDFHLFGPVL